MGQHLLLPATGQMVKGCPQGAPTLLRNIPQQALKMHRFERCPRTAVGRKPSFINPRLKGM
jgi:hypothetical protein